MARGRLINKTICASLKFHNLPDDTCRLLATWIISHLDMDGVFYGDPVMIKSFVFPRRADISVEQVERYLRAMEDQELIIRYEANGETWQCWPGFADNQPNLRRDREQPLYPAPPPERRQDAVKMPVERRQDAPRIPAEVKLSEDKLSEGAAAQKESITLPTPAMQHYEDTYGLFESKRDIDALISVEQDIGPDTVKAAIDWAHSRGIDKVSAIVTAARGWNADTGPPGGNGTGPPRQPTPPTVTIAELEATPDWIK